MSKKKGRSFDGGPVGYKRPPAEHQFKKGQKPPGSGRKKGSKNLATASEEVLAKRLPVTIDGKRKVLCMRDALLLRATSVALNGTVNQVCRLLDTLARLAPNQTKEPLVIQYRKMEGDDW